MQPLRDDPDLRRRRAGSRASTPSDRGQFVRATFDFERGRRRALHRHAAHGPRVAILREQGVNGQVEMAAAFDRAGFAAVDVHMSDLLEGRVDLSSFRGLAACGGFSYGDVLGAGEGWAKSILFNAARTRRVLGLLRAQRHLHAGRLQRLPDDVEPARS